MTNIIDRDDFWYFFIGRDLYSINAIQGTVSVGEVSGLSGCDYVKYVAERIEFNEAYLYCNNNRVHKYDFTTSYTRRRYPLPYYPCQDRNECFYQNNKTTRNEAFNFTADHEFGVCLGIRPIFVAIDKTQRTLIVEIESLPRCNSGFL